jgi:hypothetical protein
MVTALTFASEVLLGRIAAFYGFSIPEAENETPLADSPHEAFGEGPIVLSRSGR